VAAEEPGLAPGDGGYVDHGDLYALYNLYDLYDHPGA
jgi:hypothetical protein